MPETPPAAILAAWGLEAATVTPAAGGHINRSWLVAPGRYLLQRINPIVFPDGWQVLENVAHVSAHLEAAALAEEMDPERRVLRLRRTEQGEPGVRGEDGACWRLLHFIEGAVGVEQVTSPDQGEFAGAAFGLFQRLVSTYDGPPLVETIPGFHDTRRRLEQLERAAHRDVARRAGEVPNELRFASRRAQYAGVLPPLIASGEVPGRIVHNDAKIANVLFDAATGAPLAVVDLDTVMPGTLLSDVGDLIRSSATTAAEDERDPARVVLWPEVIEQLLAGFLREAGSGLTDAEREHLIFAGILLTYEQGVRFLTDYLEGDRYYRVTRPAQNIERVRAQFRLVECLEEARSTLERRVKAIGA
ncbi:MAG: aminoglycoside phosphotransferase family protein [Gemmatimonadales bacterium]